MRSGQSANLAASIRQRLLNIAKTNGDEFQRVLVRYALERLLYRLSVSDLRDRFLLKGALLFAIWSPRDHRATKDMDLLGYGEPSRLRLEREFRALSAIVVDDGIKYLAETVRCEEIRSETEYGGLRISLIATLGTAEIPVQVDVGFGDIVTPQVEMVEFPTLLNLPSPRIRAYPRETVIAEKFEAMVTLGLSNSRMKDFFDVWILIRNFEFEFASPLNAIAATFERRGTPLPAEVPIALTNEFSRHPSKLSQWQAFCRRFVHSNATPALEDVAELLAGFLLPLLNSIRIGTPYDATWPPGGPWVDKGSRA